MFKILYYIQLGITALMIYSWSNKVDTGKAVLVFLVISGVVTYFQYAENHLVASIVLYGFYVLGLCWFLWHMKHANWH